MIASPGPASSLATSLVSSSCVAHYAVSFSLTTALTRLPSARPCTRGITIDMTRPISFGEAAPRLGHHVAHDLVQLLVGELRRHVLLDQRRLALLAAGEVLAPGLAVGAGGLEPALALALEHRHLVGLAPGGVLVGLLELVAHEPQRADALAVAALHCGGDVLLDALEQRHVGQV